MKLSAAIAVVVCICCLAAFKPFSISDSKDMKKVFLLRHAKSSHDNPKLADIDRTLDPEGKKDAAEMGEYLANSGEKIELIVASPSVRTRETAAIICEKLKYDFKTIKWDSTIYACTSEALLDCIKRTGKSYNSVLFLGHNNSMTQVANLLQKDVVIADMPTCAIAGIAFKDQEWNAITTGKLFFYKAPR
jgi:phosphohistidine phosphatase